MAIIDKPTDYFNTKLYTGDGSTSRSITGVGFQPDLLWVKSRSYTYYHALWDAVRTNKSALYSNATNAEDTSTGGTLGSLDSDGFTTANVSGGGFININAVTYTSWNWKANGAGSANTDGSISSTVSANTTSGFSIVTVANVGSGNFTFGHGLGVAPSWVLAKSRDGGKWNNYFKSLGAGYTIQLPETGAKIVNNTMWQNTSPTSSVVYSHGGQLDANESYVFYCFAEKTGFSKFGSYVGNGNADGTFVYLGFKPAFLLYKNSTASATNWQIHDSKRSPSNLSVNRLNPNDTSVELGTTADSFDFLSNGFKARATASNSNTSGATFIYMAFAENPFVSSTGVPATAR
jgi:hypothetical protein